MANSRRRQCTVPRLGDEMRSAILIRFLVPVGGAVHARRAAVRAGHRQGTQEVEAEADGVLLRIDADGGRRVRGGRDAGVDRRAGRGAAVAVLHLHRFGAADGAPLLALHGVTGHGGRFRALAERGLPERRWLALDLRGHGRLDWRCTLDGGAARRRPAGDDGRRGRRALRRGRAQLRRAARDAPGGGGAGAGGQGGAARPGDRPERPARCWRRPRRRATTRAGSEARGAGRARPRDGRRRRCRSWRPTWRWRSSAGEDGRYRLRYCRSTVVDGLERDGAAAGVAGRVRRRAAAGAGAAGRHGGAGAAGRARARPGRSPDACRASRPGTWSTGTRSTRRWRCCGRGCPATRPEAATPPGWEVSNTARAAVAFRDAIGTVLRDRVTAEPRGLSETAP